MRFRDFFWIFSRDWVGRCQVNSIVNKETAKYQQVGTQVKSWSNLSLDEMSLSIKWCLHRFVKTLHPAGKVRDLSFGFLPMSSHFHIKWVALIWSQWSHWAEYFYVWLSCTLLQRKHIGFGVFNFINCWVTFSPYSSFQCRQYNFTLNFQTVNQHWNLRWPILNKISQGILICFQFPK